MLTKKEQKKQGNWSLRQGIKKNTLTYVVAAFSLIAGLAWNEAIKAIIEYFFPFDKGSILAKLIYAIIITLIAVLATSSLLNFLKKEEE